MTYLPSFTTNKSKVFHLTALSLALALAGCGGDSVDSIAPKPDIGVISTPSTGSSNVIDSAEVFISLDKDELNTGSDNAKATILVTDKNGGILSGVPVELSIIDAAKYGLSLGGASKQTTDANGKVEVDIIQNNANTDAQIDHQTKLQVVVRNSQKNKISEQSVPIVVTGTQVDNVKASTGVLGPTDNFSVDGKLIDGGGNSIKEADVILYNDSKAIATGKTDAQGKFIFDITSSLLKAINDNYILSLEVKGSQGVSQIIPNIIEIPSTSSVNISFPKIDDILVTARRRVDINVPNAKDGDTVYISTDKGLIYKGTKEEVGFEGSQRQSFTVKNKQVTFYIRSEAVGAATVKAQYNGKENEANISFVSTSPAKMILQVDKAVLGTGDSTPVAVKVYDKNDNPVKNAIVSFTIIRDSSAGRLSQATAYTDESGSATINYNAGATPTGADGVHIKATVQSVRLPDGRIKEVNTLDENEYLTVQTSSSYVGFAFADKVSTSDNNIYYIRQGSIFVLNNVGQPAANQKVTLSVIPDRYYTGSYRILTRTVTLPAVPNAGGNTSNNGGSGTNSSGSNTSGTQNAPTTKNVEVWAWCSKGHPSEDKNQNGSLDPNEDVNGNGRLDPINVATILRTTENVSDKSIGQAKNVTFTTDSTGKVDFVVRYPKEYAQWFTAKITVNTRVDGSESQSSRPIRFPVLESDIDLEKRIFPNRVSPFGNDDGDAANCIPIEKSE